MKKYLIDGEEADMRDLIDKAKGYSEEFSQHFVKLTSEAAEILRKNGHTVENNPNFK
jgi:hypothetical protein